MRANMRMRGARWFMQGKEKGILRARVRRKFGIEPKYSCVNL